jgi:hypothetical protein
LILVNQTKSKIIFFVDSFPQQYITSPPNHEEINHILDNFQNPLQTLLIKPKKLSENPHYMEGTLLIGKQKHKRFVISNSE